MRFPSLLASLLLLLIGAGHCCASNNYFMPGDAFFHVTVTEELLDALDKQSPPYVWDYSLRDTFEMAFCGYAGYEKATVAMADEQFVANLRKVYDDVRRFDFKEIREIRRDDGTRTTEETNGLHLFFYRDDFDLNDWRHKLALRYNEKWREECLKFDTFPRLCCFVNSPSAIEADWRDGELFPGLEAALPEVEIQGGHAVSKPIALSKNVKAIVLYGADLESYFKMKKGSRIYIIDSQGITERIAYNNEWLTEEKWDSLDIVDRLPDDLEQ